MRCPACHRRLAPGAACPAHPAERAPEGPAPVEPPVVEGVQAGAFLGGGGYASVFAWGDDEALKIAHTPADPRFAREAAALARVGVPRLVRTGALDARPYLIMERLRGRTLADAMAARPEAAWPPGEACAMLAALCGAVARVHEAGVVHRDVKPENLFLREDGGVTLLDLGLARLPGESGEGAPELALTRTGQGLGTPTYMAPEQCDGARHADTRADVYALGVIAFELVTGRPPFVGEDALVMQAHVSRRPPRPAALEEVILGCLAKEPAARPQGARALAEAFARVARSAPVAATAAATPVRPRSAVRPVALLGVAGAVGVVEVAEAAAAEGGQVLRTAGTRYLVGFPLAPSAAEGARAAARAARRLAARTERPDALVIHVADLRVREAAGGAMGVGAALDRPDDWCAVGARGLIVTEAAAGVVDAAVLRAMAGGDAQPTLAGKTPNTLISPAHVPLVGRDAELAAALASARACLAGRRATLVTFFGDAGLGKSRLLAAVGDALRRDVPELRVVALAAPAAEAARRDEALRALIQVAAGERELQTVFGATWPAVAFALDHLPADDPRVAPILSAPGALRQSVAKALGDALRAAAPLALVVDDAHLLDPTSLDALEIATLSDGPDAAIWVCAGARPALLELREEWAGRAAAHAEHTLARLDEEASRKLILGLLRSVEFVSDAIVARLLELGEGTPLYFVEIAHMLRAEGLIRAQGQDGWYIAADELLRVSSTPLIQRLAERALVGLTPPLAALARVCAVLGDEATRAEIDAVQALLPEPPELDTGVGLARLVSAGLLASGGGFRHRMFRDAIEELTPAAARRALHEAAFRALGSSAPPARRARHAAAAGRADEACALYLALAEDARVHNRYLEAEQHYSAVLEQLAGAAADDERRQRALTGRGKVRHRHQRDRAALEDVRAAREIAEGRGDRAAIVDLLLEEATIFDGLADFATAAEVAGRALAFADAGGDARCLMVRARVFCRRDECEESVPLFREAVAAARRAGDRETEIVASVLLAWSLVALVRSDEAETVYAAVLDLCREAGDRYHSWAIYNNRVVHQFVRGRSDLAEEDARTAIAIARELGFMRLERSTAHNLASLLHMNGRLDEAVALARRCRLLAARFLGDVPVPDDAILLARILAAKGERGEALGEVVWLRARFAAGALSPQHAVLVDTLEAIGAPAAAWGAIVARAQKCCMPGDLEEVLYWAASFDPTSAAAAWIEQGLAVTQSILWRERLLQLKQQRVA